MKANRIISILLLAAMSISFAACAEAADKDENPAESDVIAETDEAETEDPVKPDLPDMDFEGATFSIASRDDSFHSYPQHTRDLYAENMTGDIINDEVYARNQRISDRYNISFYLYTENEVTNELTTITAVEKSVVAGTYDFDLLCAHMIYGAASVIKGYYLNWNSIPYIDSTAPYWCQGAVEGYSVGDRLLLSLSDMCVSSNDCTHCFLFNKELANEYNIENCYDLVKNNEWTFPKFRELISNVTTDLDGNGKFTSADRYGYAIGGTSGLLNYLWAGGSQVCSKDESNYPFLDMMSERTVAVYDFIYEVYNSDDSFVPDTGWQNEANTNFFAENKALFMSEQVGMINNLRNMDKDFGILPYPKFDEVQENYAHYVDGHATLMTVPMTVESPERTGIIIEALSYDSYKNLRPIYYDTVTTTKYTRDEESGEMLNIIYNTRVFDFAYVYDDWKLSFAFSNMLTSNNSNFASFYAKNEKSEIRRIDKVIKVYEDLEG